MKPQPQTDSDALRTPLVEAVYLPLSAGVAAGGAVWVALRVVALTTGMTVSWVHYALLLCAALVGSAFTSVRGVLDLPFSLRLVDCMLIPAAAALLCRLVESDPGILRLSGVNVPVELSSIYVLAAMFAWFFGSSLAWVVPRLYPPLAVMEDPALDERLAQAAPERLVYSGGVYSVAARMESLRRVYQMLLLMTLVYLGFTTIWPPARVAVTDLNLAAYSALTFVFLLVYLALVHLAARRRTAERMPGLMVKAEYSRAWAAAAVPVLAAGVIACVLPANISPLAGIDYNAVMDRFTKWLVGMFFQRGRRRIGFAGNAPGIGTEIAGGGAAWPTMGGGGGTGAEDILILLAFPALIYVVFRAVRQMSRFASVPLHEEMERGHGFWALIKALLTWPWRFLFRRRRKAEGEESAADKAGLLRRLRQSMTAGRRVAYPDDPALFVRFVYARMLHEAGQAGMTRRQAQTAWEYAQHLAGTLPEGKDSVEELTHAYCNVRYTRRAPDVGMKERATQLFRSIARSFRSLKRQEKDSTASAGEN